MGPALLEFGFLCFEFGSLNANSWRYHWQGRPTHMGRPSSWVARTIGEPRWQPQPQPQRRSHANEQPKPLPAPNSDFYELAETLNAEELAV